MGGRNGQGTIDDKVEQKGEARRNEGIEKLANEGKNAEKGRKRGRVREYEAVENKTEGRTRRRARKG